MDFCMLWIAIGATALGIIVLLLLIYGKHLEDKDK